MYLSMGQIFLNRTSTHKTTSFLYLSCFFFSESLDLPLTVDQYLQMSHEQQEKLFPSVELLPGKEPQNHIFTENKFLVTRCLSMNVNLVTNLTPHMSNIVCI